MFQLSKLHIWAIKVTESTRGPGCPIPAVYQSQGQPKPTKFVSPFEKQTAPGPPVSSLVDTVYMGFRDGATGGKPNWSLNM